MPLPPAAGMGTALASSVVVQAGHLALPGAPRLINLAWSASCQLLIIKDQSKPELDNSSKGPEGTAYTSIA